MFKSKIIKLLKVQIAKMLIVKIIEFLALGIKPKLPPVGGGLLFVSLLSSKLGIFLSQILIWLPLWPQLTPRPLKPNFRILISPKDKDAPKKLGPAENWVIFYHLKNVAL